MKNFSRQDARLTLQFLPLVARVRWQLWRRPFARLHAEWRALVQDELDRATATEISVASPPSPEERELIREVWQCAHAVRRAARLVPRGSCLTQAMALQLVLAQRGQSCFVRIGVNRSAPDAALASNVGRFEAHAWVEWQGRVLLGGDISRWKPLTVFAPATSRDKTASTLP